MNFSRALLSVGALQTYRHTDWCNCKHYLIAFVGAKNITRKRSSCKCIATSGHPTPRQSFSALITTPCQVWSRWTYPLAYYSVL